MRVPPSIPSFGSINVILYHPHSSRMRMIRDLHCLCAKHQPADSQPVSLNFIFKAPTTIVQQEKQPLFRFPVEHQKMVGCNQDSKSCHELRFPTKDELRTLIQEVLTEWKQCSQKALNIFIDYTIEAGQDSFLSNGSIEFRPDSAFDAQIHCQNTTGKTIKRVEKLICSRLAEEYGDHCFHLPQ